jgi:glycosyltransferase involved in cell wall biosynthesis
MKISIITPNYNDLRIKKTLDSIYAQTYKDIEVIVVDGLSSKPQVLEIYKQYPLDILIHEKDKGIFDALNKGINRASGDIIFLIGSDDYIRDDNTFESVVSTFKKDNTLDGVCIGCELIDDNGKIVRKWYEENISSSKMKWGILPPHFSLFLKKELYELTGRFQIDYSKNLALDAIWLLKLATLKNVKIYSLSQHTTMMGHGGTSTGSYRNILKAMVITSKGARDLGIKGWLFFPFIKVIRKIPQFFS